MKSPCLLAFPGVHWMGGKGKRLVDERRERLGYLFPQQSSYWAMLGSRGLLLFFDLRPPLSCRLPFLNSSNHFLPLSYRPKDDKSPRSFCLRVLHQILLLPLNPAPCLSYRVPFALTVHEYVMHFLPRL